MFFHENLKFWCQKHDFHLFFYKFYFVFKTNPSSTLNFKSIFSNTKPKIKFIVAWAIFLRMYKTMKRLRSNSLNISPVKSFNHSSFCFNPHEISQHQFFYLSSGELPYETVRVALYHVIRTVSGHVLSLAQMKNFKFDLINLGVLILATLFTRWHAKIEIQH